ncbi:MAG TPA: class I SAM-dependent methyltransferase [Verrucomicrobiota bacterium]|nr:class I SAM-dependent methyltransferase [Verrucomicrobiota bacterium]
MSRAHGSPPTRDPRVAFFDRQAPTWDRTGPDPDATMRRLRELDGRLGLKAGLDLLEVGCGTGQITGWLASTVRPGRVVAVDFSEGMLAQARARGVDAEFVLLDICGDEPFEGSFDRVLCFHSFPHFRDQAGALRRMARHLKPGGQLLVLHLAGSSQLNAFHQSVGGAVGHDHLPPAARWPALLRPVGLEVREAVDRADLFLLKAEAGARGGTMSGGAFFAWKGGGCDRSVSACQMSQPESARWPSCWAWAWIRTAINALRPGRTLRSLAARRRPMST